MRSYREYLPMEYWTVIPIGGARGASSVVEITTSSLRWSRRCAGWNIYIIYHSIMIQDAKT